MASKRRRNVALSYRLIKAFRLPLMTETNNRTSLLVATLPLILLVIALSLNVYIYGDDAVSGSNQIILIVCAAIASIVALANGSQWGSLEKGIIKSIQLATPAVLILLMVGALSGTWLVSGIIPAMVYYGLQIISPSIFLISACIICALVSLFAGSSWTTSATMGIALMGIGKVLGIHEGLIAGAILSGAYFGDKLSPLSDTTNLASASSGSELFSHIRYLTITTVPSFAVTLIIFGLLGLTINSSMESSDLKDIILKLDQAFNITPWLITAPLFVIAMILSKIPALPALFGGTTIGVIFAFIFQGDTVSAMSNGTDYNSYRGIMITLFGSIQLHTGNAILDELLSSSGMAGMLTTVWLIIAAMVYGGVMEASGFLNKITEAMIKNVKSIAGLITSTGITCIFTNLTTSDQYLSVLIPGRMYAEAYKKRSLAPENLSRTLEDTGTVTSVLIPWNTCGAYHAAVLGVATLSYLPFVFFCLISPIATLLVAFTGYKIKMIKASDSDVEAATPATN